MTNYRSGSGPDRNPDPRFSASASVPPASGGNRRAGNTYGGSGGRRTSPPGSSARMAVIICLVVSVIATVGGVGVWAYAKSLNDGLDRMDAFDGVTDRPEASDGMNIMILGSDSRNPESTEGTRADTIMLMHIPGDGQKAYLISLPRDLWVNIPASGDWQGGESKLNSALAFGGIPLIVQTVEDFTDVLIDHVLEIDFDGLKKVVDSLGGVTMDVEPADDGTDQLTSIHTYKGEDEPRTWDAGKQEMNGEEALDYVRQRKQFAEGDFARMRHQQDLLMAMMDKATSSGLTDPAVLPDFLNSVIDAVKVDEDFDLVATALSYSSLRSDDLVFLTSPNDGSGMVGDESVVLPNQELAGSMYKSIAADTMGDWIKDNPDAVKGGASDDSGEGE